MTSVALSYVTASDSGLAAPPASSPSSSGEGSVGTFVGTAVAAVLGLTVLAGKHQAVSPMLPVYSAKLKSTLCRNPRSLLLDSMHTSKKGL